MILFYDTETTGLPDWKKPSDDPCQPHLVQLAALLIDPDTRTERAAIDLLVAPDDWTIPEEISKIHGISTETARQSGVSERVVTDLFLDLQERANLEVAHNVSFDRRIMRIAMRRRMGMTREEIEEIEKCPVFDTMKISSPIVNLPPTDRMLAAGFTKPKPPKLAECIRYFFNEELEDAHNALADVRATARLYFHLQDIAKKDAA